ncbi:unnamed protein product [Rhizopus stolonifer]
MPNNDPIVSASDIPKAGLSAKGKESLGEIPHTLEIHEIKQTVQDFKQANLNAIEAGFDSVEIHNANGYLLDQFLNSSSNVCSDEYGDSAENKTHFSLEVVDAVINVTGHELTAIRFFPGISFQDIHGIDTLGTWDYATQALQKKHPQLAYIHFAETRSTESGTCDLDCFCKVWKGPFITTGNFSTDLTYAHEVVNSTGNLIAFGRAFLSNSDLPKRIEHNRALNKYHRLTFYIHEAIGYNDYPFYIQ